MTNDKQLICGGEFEIVKMTKDMDDEAWEIFRDCFMVHENISIALNLGGSPESLRDMEILFRGVLQDRISFAARHCETQKLAAFAVNKMLNPSTKCDCDEIFGQLKAPVMHVVGAVLDRMETTVSVYKEWNIDCVMEIFFVSTRPEFSKRGLASKLFEYSIEYARKMSHGNLPAEELLNLPAHVRNEKPKAATSFLTSCITQLIAQKLNFQVLHSVPYTEFEYEGKTFAEKLDPMHKCGVYAALRL